MVFAGTQRHGAGGGAESPAWRTVCWIYALLPGGKSTQIAASTCADRGLLVSNEPVPKRAASARAGIMERMGVTNALAVSALSGPCWRHSGLRAFDAVLVDAPVLAGRACSGAIRETRAEWTR